MPKINYGTRNAAAILEDCLAAERAGTAIWLDKNPYYAEFPHGTLWWNPGGEGYDGLFFFTPNAELNSPLPEDDEPTMPAYEVDLPGVRELLVALTGGSVA